MSAFDLASELLRLEFRITFLFILYDCDSKLFSLETDLPFIYYFILNKIINYYLKKQTYYLGVNTEKNLFESIRAISNVLRNSFP